MKVREPRRVNPRVWRAASVLACSIVPIEGPSPGVILGRILLLLAMSFLLWFWVRLLWAQLKLAQKDSASSAETPPTGAHVSMAAASVSNGKPHGESPVTQADERDPVRWLPTEAKLMKSIALLLDVPEARVNGRPDSRIWPQHESTGLCSFGPDDVVANFRIECPVDGSNVVFATQESAAEWLVRHRQVCTFHAGGVCTRRVPGKPITAWMAWNMSKWKSRWWWHGGLKEWQWIEAQWTNLTVPDPAGGPPRNVLVHRLDGTELLIKPGGGASG